MKIGIVGAGITGLTAAYKLSREGHKVVVFEKENYVGGLAAGFTRPSQNALGRVILRSFSEGGSAMGDWDWCLENYFHHLFVSDTTAEELIDEIGLSDKLFFRRPKSSIYYDGKINQFDSPLSVLKFPYLSFPDRLRTGLVTAYLKTTNGWEKFEKVTAQEWLTKFYGQKTYEVLWAPLLRSKFGDYADQISMAWFRARIKKRSSKLGYIEGGFQVLIDKLVEKIEENGGEICLAREISEISEIKEFDRTIFTTPIESEKLKWVGALNLILLLKEKFLTDGTYWLNINEPNFPFVAVVEHTNFVDKKHYGGNHILYLGGYYPQGHRYFKMSKEEIFEEFLPYLKKINPKFSHLSSLTSHLSTNLFAQPVIPTNYSQLIPSFKTSDPRIFRANMQMVYPWDRGVNYAIELGKKVANEILKVNGHTIPANFGG